MYSVVLIDMNFDEIQMKILFLHVVKKVGIDFKLRKVLLPFGISAHVSYLKKTIQAASNQRCLHCLSHGLTAC